MATTSPSSVVSAIGWLQVPRTAPAIRGTVTDDTAAVSRLENVSSASSAPDTYGQESGRARSVTVSHSLRSDFVLTVIGCATTVMTRLKAKRTIAAFAHLPHTLPG